MKIESVQVENIRSHVKSTVLFERGFNCIVGGVGTGKSSILYAIDFALFGEPLGRSFEYLIRDSADKAKVTVRFAQNGRVYKLVRGLRRRGKGISQDIEELKLFEDEKLLASMKSDAVAEQFKAITGLDKILYREIVWVRQEHLKELLDAAPRDRQRRLDELFGLSDYEVAWSNIATYQRDYETERRVYEKDPDVVGLEKLCNEYNHITEEFALLEIELQNTFGKLAETKRNLEKADEKLTKIEDKKLQIEELKRKESEVQANISSVADAVVSLSKRIEGKETIIDNLKKRQVSLNTQIIASNRVLDDAGVTPNQPFKEIRDKLAILDDQLSNLRAEMTATLGNMQADKERKKSLSAESRCPLCLQSLNDQYKTVLIKKIQQDNMERENAVWKLQSEIEEMQRTKAVANEAFSNLKTLTTRNDDLRTRLSEEVDNLADLANEVETKRQLKGNLVTQLEALHFEISKFDLSDLEDARMQREQAFAQYYRVEADLRTKEIHKKELGSRLDDIKDRIDHAQEKLERVKRITQTVEVLGAIRDAYRSIQPKLRSEFVIVLHNFVQQVLDSLVGSEAPLLNVVVDETYTPHVRGVTGTKRDVSNLSGGERTLLAFA
ncbi:MAG: SMC family ATPase, partial [Candidatus Bathyarchaeota archaeon]|nr:SMC family ATPase [Candidatus Bathyarchaeota archaeon]